MDRQVKKTNLWQVQAIITGTNSDVDAEGTHEFNVATDTAEDAMELVCAMVRDTRILRAVTDGKDTYAIRDPRVRGWMLIKCTQIGVLRDA